MKEQWVHLDVGIKVTKSVNTSRKLIILLVVSLEKHKINHSLDCNDKCLAYLLTCNKYKRQNTGQTTGNFRGRWNNYKSRGKSFKRGEKCMQERLCKHFESEGHTEFLLDVSITLIDKTDGSNLTKRKNYWMRTLNPIQDGWGENKKPPPTSFSPVTSTNVGIIPPKFLTFSFNPFDRLV